MATPHRDYWRTVRTAAPTGRDGPRGRPYRRRLLPDSTSSSRTRHDDIFGNLFNTKPPRGGRLKKHFDRMASPLQNHRFWKAPCDWLRQRRLPLRLSPAGWVRLVDTSAELFAAGIDEVAVLPDLPVLGTPRFPCSDE